MTTVEEMAVVIERLKAQLAASESKVAALEAEKAKDGAPTPQVAEKEAFPPAVVQNGLFEKYVEKACSDKSTGKLDAEAAGILRGDVELLWERLAGFAADNNDRAYGLAVGRVQSGKTRNYIGLMFKAIENGFNTVVILTSKNKRLAYQTYGRVRELLDDPKIGVRNRNWLTRSIPRDQSIQWMGGNFVPDGVNIAVVLKNEAGHLRELKNWLATQSTENKLGQMRLLFVDDESDSATPNTNSVQELTVNSKEDIRQLAACIGEDWSDVRDWLQSLAAREFENDAVNSRMQELVRRAAISQESFMTLVRDDKEMVEALGLDTENVIDGQIWKLSARVHDVFNKDGRRRSPNWCDLRDVLEYLFDIAPERSKINKSICDLVGSSAEAPALLSFGRMAYVAYTATPFANLLKENPTTDPLCPDFIQSLGVSPKYFGLDRIFGGKSGSCNMSVVRLIPSEEYEGWVVPMQTRNLGDESVTPTLSRNHNFATEKEPEDARLVEWTSLKRAVMWAFCTAAARRCIRKQGDHANDDRVTDTKYRWTTMLFNISHLSDQESGVHSLQQRLVQGYVDWCQREENRPDFIKACMRMWEEEVRSFTKGDFMSAVACYGEVGDYPPSWQVEKELKDWFLSRGGKVRVVQMNSKTLDGNAENYYRKDCEDGDVLWIVCGGNAISRGLTLEGLTVSYFDRVRRGSAVDTVTQMGRWFGYRQGYELLPRVWMTAETANVMKEICRTENQLHEAIRQQSEAEGLRSIRQGHDVTNVRFFGRRLASRDANSERLDGVDSYDVFNCLREDATGALKATKELVENSLGLGNCKRRAAEDGFCDNLHRRHAYYWQSVDKAIVSGYLERMRDYALCSSSRDGVSALLREMANSVGLHWNIVIGSPEKSDERLKLKDIPGLDVCMRERSQSIAKIPDGVCVGHSTLAGQAFLAGIPSKFINRGKANAEANDPRHSDVLGNIKTVERIYDQVKTAAEGDASRRAELRELINPCLCIDFVRGGGGETFVLLSFYWHGHSAESYVRAVLNPSRPALVPKAFEIIIRQHYISKAALIRALEIDEADSRAFLAEMDAALARQEDARRTTPAQVEGSMINSDVFYSEEWAKSYSPCGSVGEKIGRHLYNQIRGAWSSDINGVYEGVPQNLMMENFRDGIIVSFMGMPDYSGFKRRYGNDYWTDELSDDYLRAVALETSGDVDAALSFYSEIAEASAYAPAEYRCGRILLDRKGMDGPRRGQMMMKRSFDQEYPAGLYMWGCECLKNVNRDFDRRDFWLAKAEESFSRASATIEHFVWLGDDESERCAAEMYYYGRGFAEDKERAHALMSKAAEHGNALARKRLEEWASAPVAEDKKEKSAVDDLLTGLELE